MKKIAILIATLLSINFIHAGQQCEKLDNAIEKIRLAKGYSKKAMLSSPLIYPTMLVCMGEEVASLECTSKDVKKAGTKSCLDFKIIWEHIYKANLVVSIGLLSGESDFPGIVACKINDNLLELMGHKFWNKIRLEFSMKGFNRKTTSWIFLPKNVCNKYSSKAR